MSRLFGKPVHTAFVVPELKSHVDRLLASGIGPVFMLRRIQGPGRYRGKRYDPITTVAFFCTGNVHYEIVEQNDDTPSAYTEFLERNPQGGLHHVAYYSKDFPSDMKRAKDAGMELEIVQEFLTPDLVPFEIYMEPKGVRDPLLVQFLYPGPSEKVFSQIEAISADWNGKNPVRSLFDILPPEIVLPVAPD